MNRARSNLALAYQAAGLTAKAIPLLEQTLDDSKRVLGADHPRTLILRNTVAMIYRSTGRTTEAIPLLEQTLNDSEQVLGVDHPVTAVVRENLATLAGKSKGRRRR